MVKKMSQIVKIGEAPRSLKAKATQNSSVAVICKSYKSVPNLQNQYFHVYVICTSHLFAQLFAQRPIEAKQVRFRSASLKPCPCILLELQAATSGIDGTWREIEGMLITYNDIDLPTYHRARSKEFTDT